MRPQNMKTLRELADISPCDWPDKADRIIMTALRSMDAEERQMAISLAGENLVMSDHMASALLAIVADYAAAPDERGNAAIALGPALEECDLMGEDDPWSEAPISKAKYAEVRAELQRAWSDESSDDLVRRRALEASVRAPESWHADAIREAFSRDDRLWQLTALFCAGHITGFDREVIAALDAKDEELLFEAVTAAGARELRLAGPHLLSLASSNGTPRHLRQAAIEALAHVDVPGRTRVLEDLAASDDAELADIASFALTEMNAFRDVEEWDEEDPPN